MSQFVLHDIIRLCSVLPFLYDGLFRNGSGSNVLEHMFPISVLRIEPGTVWGVDRIVTSKSGQYGFASIGSDGDAVPQLHEGADGSGTKVTVLLYSKGFLISNVTTAGAVAHVKMGGSVDMAVLVLV